MATVQEALAQAKEAAANMAGGTDVIEASVSPAGIVTNFAKPSMAHVAASTSVIPKQVAYLKVNEFGIRVGKSKEFLSELEGDILMVEDKGFQLKHTLRFGNPAVYLSTYDGQVCDKGGSWLDALRRAKAADPKSEAYISVDAVITLTKEVKLKDQTLAVGTKLGINTAKTNFSDWSDFYAKCNEEGLLNTLVPVKLSFRDIEHNGNCWGVFIFELNEPA